jgi:hypothetical protein
MRRRLLVKVGIILFILAASARPSTAVTLINVAESGYRYCLCPYAPGMEDPGFDDSAFIAGKAPFCNLTPACSPLEGTTLNFGSIVARKKLVLSGSPTNAVLSVQFHSGATVFVNGKRIGQFGNGCDWQSNSTAIDLPEGLLHAGDNVITMAVISTFNSGTTGYLDLQLEADGATTALSRSWGQLKASYR